ncbi:MAG TPA: alpha/beta family hydrolase [Ohtaekwangia sp.]|nr:alpha/beta family hydrolase [Ohtaekwangia sp.]
MVVDNLTVHSFQLPVNMDPGHISVEIYEPSKVKAALTIAHGAGTNMHHSFLKSLSQEFARHDIMTVRFNFPYMEKGRKMPDRYPVASKAIRAVLEEIHQRYPHLPLFAGGKSFGGRMSSQTLAETPLSYIHGVVFFGFPLHPANQPSLNRADHLNDVAVPMLFLQGTRDALADNDLIYQVCERLPLATLIRIEGADHSFNKGKAAILQSLCSHTVDWLKRTLIANG